ncbi:MAG TPA: S9 family peptidase [Flavobacteriales bacterium]|nr:S9 family peptidase [Flavobacteriales bacterium]
MIIKYNYIGGMLSITGALIFGTGCVENRGINDKIMAPIATKIEKELSIHGHVRIDPYYWLNERKNQKVLDYLKAENEYAKAKLEHTEALQEKIYQEIIGRIKQTDMSVPYTEEGYYYYTRYEEGSEYPVYLWEKQDGSADQLDKIIAMISSGERPDTQNVLLNVNELAKGHDYYDVSGVDVSPDNKILAYGVDTVSRRQYTIHFKNLEGGDQFEERIKNTTGGITWANDNRAVYYSLQDETLRSYKIFKHVLGTDPKEDVEIFHEKDDTFGTYIYKTKSKKYLVISSYSTLSTEYRVLDADNSDGEFSIIQERERDLEYSIDHYGDKFYIKTNLDAKNFRLMETPVDATSKENWKEVIAHRRDVMLEGIEIFNDYLVLEERKNGLTEIRIIRWEDWSEHYLDFGEPTYTSYTWYNPDYDTEILRYGYTSMTTPSSTLDYNMATREKKLLKQQEVVGDFNKGDYASERMYAKARDGVEVPISLVYKKGIKKDGRNPLLLYGYGSYGASMDPYFSSIRLSLLDRGFIFAIAHIRGGEDLGRAWYEDGKLLKKMNTFTDFIDCGEYLIAENYTSGDSIFAAGGSAGGLLMGAVINLRPDLFKAILASVPFVDVVTTMLDESIPLTTGEFDEWGNPKEKKYYEYMLTYSPYDNVEAKDYPAMLITTGLHDSQVQYFEPAKWVAKLRDMKTDDNLLLLHTNMDAGHGGQSGRFRRNKETALEYAFLLDQIGITE